jgi:hypothetical protein
MSKECISEEIPSKRLMTKDILDISWSLCWFACMDKDLENHFALS